MNKTTFALIEQYMQACMKDSAHDQEHVWRVLNNALEIGLAMLNTLVTEA